MKLSIKELWPVIIVYFALTLLAVECSAQSIQYKDLQTIFEAADAYKLNADKLVRIAYVESKFTHNAIRKNKNGTIDIGYFQINSIHWDTTCKEFDLLTFKGQAFCAAKLLSMHRISAYKDVQWIARFHSRTPSLKAAYYLKLQSVPAIKVVNYAQ